MSSETRSALKRPIAQFAAMNYPQMNRFLMLAEILFDVEEFIAVIALKRWGLVVDHVGLEIADRVEDFSALLTWNFLFGS